MCVFETVSFHGGGAKLKPLCKIKHLGSKFSMTPSASEVQHRSSTWQFINPRSTDTRRDNSLSFWCFVLFSHKQSENDFACERRLFLIRMVKISNFINGLAVPVSGKATIDVLDPSTGKFISQLPLSRSIDTDAAVVAANTAYASWRLLSMKRKASVILKLSVLVESYSNELAALISLESGKNLQEALIDVSKSVEMLEWAVNLPQFAMGSQYELTRDVPCEETRQAIGVVAAILPFSSLGEQTRPYASKDGIDFLKTDQVSIFLSPHFT